MKSRQMKKTEEKHELEEEIGGSENKRINARRHRHYLSMEEKVRDRLVRLSFAVKSAGELARAVKSAGELVSVVGFDRRRIQNQSGELSDLELGGK
ncbi:hypothetical protein HID58_070524 [Brassica napus]|uniref:Uncharacterized protein n=1 Tax=Brassica napus TaxID=3708 RepID=A0ABQ7YZ01_BRANA|nr:hypothetical protein HID58_070524 [Brassica napus]